MNEVFGATYAGLYDAFYGDKDYAAECDRLEELFSRYVAGGVRDVLDLGCGTGGHSHLLAERGYTIMGVDRSPHMIEQARRKAARLPSANRPTYEVADLRHFRSDRRFDAVAMMSAVFDYLLEDDDALAALRTAHVHLREGGLLLFDCWHGPAVLHERPSSRTKEVDTARGRVVRSSSTELDAQRHRCTVHFHVEESHAGTQHRTDETHHVRFFFPAEIERFLLDSGFSTLRIGDHSDFNNHPNESTWHILVAARSNEPAPSPPDAHRKRG